MTFESNSNRSVSSSPRPPPIELFLNPDEYEAFQRNPHSYLGVDASEVDLDIQIRIEGHEEAACEDLARCSSTDAPPGTPRMDKDCLVTAATGTTAQSASMIAAQDTTSPNTTALIAFNSPEAQEKRRRLSRFKTIRSLPRSMPPTPQHEQQRQPRQHTQDGARVSPSTTTVVTIPLLLRDANFQTVDGNHETLPSPPPSTTAPVGDTAREDNGGTSNAEELRTTPAQPLARRRYGKCLTKKSRDILCQAILDRCPTQGGRMKRSAIREIATHFGVGKNMVNEMRRSILRSVVETGRIDPTYKKSKRQTDNRMDLDLAYAALSRLLLQSKRKSASSTSAAASSTQSVATAATTAGLIVGGTRHKAAGQFSLLGGCPSTASKPTMASERSPCNTASTPETAAFGDASGEKKTSLKATDDDYDGNFCARQSMSAVHTPTRPATAQQSLARKGNVLTPASRDIVRQALLARCDTNSQLQRATVREIQALYDVGEQTVREVWKRTLRTMMKASETSNDTDDEYFQEPPALSVVVPRQQLVRTSNVGHLTPESREIVCQALLDRCHLSTGRLKKGAVADIAAGFQTGTEAVYNVWKRMLASVANTGVIDPKYIKARTRYDPTCVNDVHAYSAMRKLLLQRAKRINAVNERPAAATANVCNLNSAPLATSKCSFAETSVLKIPPLTFTCVLQCEDDAGMDNTMNSKSASSSLHSQIDNMACGDIAATMTETATATAQSQSGRFVKPVRTTVVTPSPPRKRKRHCSQGESVAIQPIPGGDNSASMSDPTTRQNVLGAVVVASKSQPVVELAVAITRDAPETAGNNSATAVATNPCTDVVSPLDEATQFLSSLFVQRYQGNEAAFRTDPTVPLVVHYIYNLLGSGGTVILEQADVGLLHRIVTRLHFCANCNNPCFGASQCRVFFIHHAMEDGGIYCDTGNSNSTHPGEATPTHCQACRSSMTQDRFHTGATSNWSIPISEWTLDTIDAMSDNVDPSSLMPMAAMQSLGAAGMLSNPSSHQQLHLSGIDVAFLSHIAPPPPLLKPQPTQHSNGWLM